MHSYLLKELLDDTCLKIDEYVILNKKSLHLKLQLRESIYFYIISGCATVYEFDDELNLINTSILAPGQLLKINTKETRTALIESLGSLDEDAKFLKIKRKCNVE
tara:strand:+ start:435 stop:749 length:315 start_codon:yes stop_codon:yes gene_type:complete